MKMILLSCCSHVANWQEVINKIPCLLWGVIGLLGFWLLLKYVVKPRCQYCNDVKVRKEKFEREKFWSFYNKIQLVSDEQLNKQIDELEKEKSKLNKDKSEKESLLNKELEIYNTILNRLNIMNQVDNIENNQ